MSPELFQQRLLSWFDKNGRKNLPWQQNITPYQTWLSEVMLQQTQVTTVIPYFNLFTEKFPNVHILAAAPIDSVLHLWAGLGYYARARNLHKTAQIISKNEGIFPNTLEALIALPGIGRSTAGAILSIAFNNSHPILDGNVRRVLARFHAISGWPGHSKVSHVLWEISARYTPVERSASYTQAIMDLGATLCTRSNPQCPVCPINSHCIAKSQDIVKSLPTPKPAKTKIIKSLFLLILSNREQQTLLEKRPASGIWGGLWSLPEFNSLKDIEEWCLTKKLPILSLKHLDKKRHTFSHYHLDYTPIMIQSKTPINNVLEANQSVWYKSEQIKSLGLPAPIKILLQNHYKEENHD